MKDHAIAGLLAPDWQCILGESDSSAVSTWRLFTIMAAIKCRNQLCKDRPHELFIRKGMSGFEVLDHDSQVSISTIFHVQMKIMRLLVMLFLEITNDIRMIQLSEDVQLSLELMALLFGHFGITYFLSTEDLNDG